MLVLMACLSVWHSNPERHLSQASPIFVFLAPRMVPGPGWCYISAPCLQSGLISAVLFILFAQRALFQPGEKKKKKKEPSTKLGALEGLLAQEAQEDPGHGKPVSCGDWHSLAGPLETTRPHQGGF